MINSSKIVATGQRKLSLLSGLSGWLSLSPLFMVAIMPERKQRVVVGQRFSRLVVLSEKRIKKTGQNAYWVASCICDCGAKKQIRIHSLCSGDTKSCGCKAKEFLTKMSTKHGYRHTAIYHVWNGMKRRCTCPNAANFHNYGGRGIKVCKRWLTPENFIEDMLPTYKKGLQIDRIDNNGNYESANCRWATPIENSRHKRDTHYVAYQSKQYCLTELAEKLSLSPSTLYGRIKRGTPLNQPLQIQRKKNESKILYLSCGSSQRLREAPNHAQGFDPKLNWVR